MNQNDTDGGLQEICRSCLETSSKMYPLTGPILNVDIDISTMITYCTSIEVSLDDDLPKGVCIPCFRTIRIAYNFICQFRETNQKLHEERELNRIKMEDETQENYILEEVDHKGEDVPEHEFDQGVLEEENIIISCETLHDVISEELNPETNQKLHEEMELNRIKMENETQQNYILQEVDHRGEDVSEHDFDQGELEEKIIISCEMFGDEIRDELNPENMISQNETSEFEIDTLESNEKSNEAVSVDHLYIEPLKKKLLKNYVCPSCSIGFRSFDSGFVPHLYTHHKDELVNCSKCSVETMLNGEMYVQHYKRIHLHQCLICHRSFGRKSSLYYHMKVHNSSKPYECSFENCKKSFLTSWSLSKHMNTHSDATKYICSKCGSKFKTYDTFRYHQKTHDGNRNHLCPECGRAFLQAVHLKYHMWKHTGIKQFHCDKCSKSYTSVTQLKKHKRKYCGAVQVELGC